MGQNGPRQPPTHMVRDCRDTGPGPSLVSPRMGRGVSPVPRKLSLSPTPSSCKHVLCLWRDRRGYGVSGTQRPMSAAQERVQTRTRDQRQTERGFVSPRSQPPIYLA